ncbi:uncharacterized protein LOC109117714 [Fukomys damarensis]|uniref:uncharacterized protein LOC109117714 n=1 Tax=Fukomys damarensis TaxID=885580 RepID=UPI0008FF4BE2|nr:uncharacterized protein LOC109117714 [Fukomys damarensis]
MGQSESKSYLADSIQSLLKAQGVTVERARLEAFVKILDTVCPWLCNKAEINTEVWETVGNQLDEALLAEPNRFPEGAPFYWALLNAALTTPTKKEILEALEKVHVGLEQIREERSQTSEPPESGKCPLSLEPPEPPDSGGPPVALYPSFEAFQQKLERPPPSAPPPTQREANLAQLCTINQELSEELQLRQQISCLSSRLASLRASEARPTNEPNGKDPIISEGSQGIASPLQEALKRAAAQGEEIFRLFPVIQVEGLQGSIREHRPLEFKLVKELKTAVNQYGTAAPFTCAILDSITGSWRNTK